MRHLLLLALIVVLAGCMTVRTYTIEKPRIDTDVEGNRGFLSGTPTEDVKENRLGDTRQISVVEVEFGTGRLKKEQASEQSFPESTFDEGPIIAEDEISYHEAEITREEYQFYTVTKNDTLQKISDKFYGTTRKWKKIFDANQKVLKNPDKVYPGTKIKIPVL